VDAVDYLLKPFSLADFMASAERLRQRLEARPAAVAAAEPGPVAFRPQDDAIFFKADYRTVRVRLADIRYIEGLKDYVKIYTEQSPRPILSLMSMKGLEEMLPATRFMRVHRSFIVNMEKVREIDRGRIVFGDVFIPVGDSYKQAFLNYIGNVR
jgi:DNA-binding LytR/AlgR family response regulator